MDDEKLRLMEAAFIDGFRRAPDKLAFLLLARVPLEIDSEGAEGLKLVEVKFEESYEVGSAHPGFGSRDLVYQPLPGTMIQSETRLSFVYVSMSGRSERRFADLAAEGLAATDLAPDRFLEAAP